MQNVHKSTLRHLFEVRPETASTHASSLMQNYVSDVVVGVAVLFTFLNGERHSCSYQSVQLVHLHAFVSFPSKSNIHRKTRGRLDEAYSDKEVSVAVQTCISFAPKIGVVVDNHSLLAIRTSDIAEGNIGTYLFDNVTSPPTTKDV